MTLKERDAILSAFKGGKNAVQVSEELRIPLSAVERLQRKSGPSAGSFAGGVHKADGGLDKALSAAGFSAHSGDNPAPIEAQKPPTITPEALVGLVVGLNGMVCRTVATIYQLDYTEKKVQDIASLTKEEKAVIEGMAPYAVDLIPEIMQYIKPAMAWSFVGVVLVTTGSRAWSLRELSPRVQEARKQKRLKKLAAPREEENA